MSGPIQESAGQEETLASLLATIARSLDVRDVFRQISEVAATLVPHDLLSLGVFDEDGARVRLHAVSDGLRRVDALALPESERQILSQDFAISSRVEVIDGGSQLRLWKKAPEPLPPGPIEMSSTPAMRRLISDNGIQSIMSVAVRLHGEAIANILFHSKDPDAFDVASARLGMRIADHVSVVLAHERLAEQARREAEARETAQRLEARVERLTAELAARDGDHRPIGQSASWREALHQATRVAATDTTVLVTGESGTGKEVIARFVHGASRRAAGPFVALNCAALPDTLLESELFGHEKGAFTGATAARMGRIEEANGGTLFLDEVGETSPAVQAKLLRALQEREVQRLGSSRAVKVDTRVIAATNRDLEEAIRQGRFREDLYYRLHVFEIHLTPLRERPDDVLLLLDHFLSRLSSAMGRPVEGFSKEARDRLLAHPWPGNVRELRNAVERAVILCDRGLITNEHLPIAVGRSAAASAGRVVGDLPAQGIDLEELERHLVKQALDRTGANKSRAAKLLGLTRSQLYTRIEKHGL